MSFPSSDLTLPLSGVVNHLWQTTVVIAVVWALSFALRRNRAGLRFHLWMFASAKFLLPFSLLIAAGQQLRPSSATPVATHALSNFVNNAVQPYATPAFQAQSAPAQQRVSSLWSVRALEISVALWAVGALAILLLWLSTWNNVRRVAAEAAPWTTVSGVPVRKTRGLLEPGVFGMVRPVLLIPEDLPTRLSTQQMDAILAHELCHVRRHDNLFAALHTLVLALFWFHPAVWLIRARLLDERERACDESVVSAGGDPALYAQSILDVCKLYIEAPATTMAGVTGGQLKRRLVRIMSEVSHAKLSTGGKIAIGVIASTLLGLPIAVGFTNARKVYAGTAAPGAFSSTFPSDPKDSTAALPSFEVISIRPSKPAEGMSWGPAGTQWEAKNASLDFLLTGAFHLRPYQLLNLPPWVRNEHYDIRAKFPDTILQLPEKQRIEQDPLLMQSLLQDRFHLRYHWGTQQHAVYSLVVDKGGPRMARPQPGDPGGYGISDHIDAHGITMEAFAELLGGNLDEIVHNNTGLSGQYAFVLRYPPPEGTPTSYRENSLSDPETKARLFSALQDQLGLKLVAEKVPVPMLVIDDLQRPTPN